MAVKILTLRRKYEHITPILQELHWLPVEHRITYTILLTTHRALNGKAPQYITDLSTPTYQRAISDLKENGIWLFQKPTQKHFEREPFLSLLL